MYEKDLTFWVDPLDGSAGFAKGYLSHITTMIGVSINNRPRLGVIHKPFSSHPYPHCERTYIGLPDCGLYTIDTVNPNNSKPIHSKP